MKIERRELPKEENHIAYALELIPSTALDTQNILKYINAQKTPEQIEIIEDLIAYIINKEAESIKTELKPDWLLTIEKVNHITFHVHLRNPELSVS